MLLVVMGYKYDRNGFSYKQTRIRWRNKHFGYNFVKSSKNLCNPHTCFFHKHNDISIMKAQI